MKAFSAITGLVLLSMAHLSGDQAAIPASVTAENYSDLLQRPPFRRVLTLSESLVLSGIATLPSGKVVTVWDRTSERSFIVSATPNPQGWKLLEVSEASDLRTVAATIAAGDQKITLRFDPERLTPRRLDNTSKPAPRNEGAVIIEALLRSLQPAAAKEFESLPPDAQESFRRAFTNYLAAYPTASDAKRLEFVQRTLEETKKPEDPGAEPAAPKPVVVPEPAPEAAKP
ncbi:MAG: hypothetical protein JWQ44_2325 [Chthoniobacter sp.]|nr:hypothetical protein [Chthoniobacter sp.]